MLLLVTTGRVTAPPAPATTISPSSTTQHSNSIRISAFERTVVTTATAAAAEVIGSADLKTRYSYSTVINLCPRQ